MKKTIFVNGWQLISDYVNTFLSPVLPDGVKNRFIACMGIKDITLSERISVEVVYYLNLLTSGRLNSYLADREEQAQERFERIVDQMKQ